MFKAIAKLFATRTFAPTPRRTVRQSDSVRLTVEALENRLVPASFTVKNATDLIAAINTANASPEADTIILKAGKTFNLDNVTLGIKANSGGLTIVGNGDIIQRKTSHGSDYNGDYDGTQPFAFRLVDVANGASLSMNDLTLQGSEEIDYGASFGGAVYNAGSLTLNHVSVLNNTAFGANAYLSGGYAAGGGGVYSSGTLIVASSIFKNNKAVGGLGAAEILPGIDWSGGDAFGGALYIDGGTALISDTIFESNVAQGGAGGSGKNLQSSNGGAAYGGAVYVAGGAVILQRVTVGDPLDPTVGNSAVGGAGGAKVGKKGQAGDNGPGFGGGIYIAPAAAVTLDAFTHDKAKHNTASTSDPDIFGFYTVIG